MSLGLRVVRGPDWAWGNQDGGEGGLGTVRKPRGPSQSRTADKTIFILWDNGFDNNYRIGHEGAYDLRLYDNAPSGVKHTEFVCNGCRRKDIAGMRFSCRICPDFDLCQICYMQDKHDLAHPFTRFTTPQSNGVELCARMGCRKVFTKGILVGACVERGKHWDWGDQDGGKGSIGRVIDIRKWDNETERSVVCVEWSKGTQNIYRVGHKGKVDLQTVTPSVGDAYYPNHLPSLGKEEDNVDIDEANRPFVVGDRVTVFVDGNMLRELQKGHGGYHPRMEEVIGNVGTIGRITEKGDVRVEYPSGSKWTLNPLCLVRTEKFDVGDVVVVSEDREAVVKLQSGHGEWAEPMSAILGRVGRVVKLYTDNDLRVSIDGCSWTLNPLCVRLHPDSALLSCPQNEDSANLSRLMKELKLDKTCISMEKILKDAAQGHLDSVASFLVLHPEMVNIKVGGKTLLQVACHQGHAGLVRDLIARGADISLADDEGDTPLHYAAFGNQSGVMADLLDIGANIDAMNSSSCSALHIAVSKHFTNCVKLLLQSGANVNLQDSYGDTALHDAIGYAGSGAIVDLLCSAPGIDFTVMNKRGFNPLHHAALKGNAQAVEKLVCRSRGLTDVKKADGFAALHLASLNGHKPTVEVLITLASATIDLRNARQFTPLMLAASQGYSGIVELLVKSGCDITKTDEEGDTALHMTLAKRLQGQEKTIVKEDAPAIFQVWQDVKKTLDSEDSSEGTSKPYGDTTIVSIAIACYLVKVGCSLDAKNNKDQTPLDLIKEDLVLSKLIGKYQFMTVLENSECEAGEEEKSSNTSTTKEPPFECAVCSESSGVSPVSLEPCGHTIACEECSAIMKKCLKCNTLIDRRLSIGGKLIPYKSKNPNTECMRYLENKIAEMEEVHLCGICMERRRDVAFLCGHGSCTRCSATLTQCHMCRESIKRRIHLYC